MIMNLMRQTNRRLILNLVQEKGPLSRGEITKQANLGVITVTKIVRDLIREDLIYESGFGVSQGGRRPVLLNFNFSSVLALGIGIEVNDDLVGIVTNLKNEIILKRRKKVIAWTKEIEVTQSIIEMIEKILKQLGRQSPKIGGIGIGVPGLVNQKRGRVKSFHKFSQWKEMSLGDIINKKFKLPVFVDNNNSCAILAEKIMGAGKGRENFLYINLGEGIGLGIIIRGQVYQGRDGDAGEFGHIVIEPNGPRCYCGNRQQEEEIK
jgi:predicted NBD/HSP70 family sugar kinase